LTSHPPTLFVVSGVQGAGKSTIARLLAERLGRGAWVSADALQRMIVSGGQWPRSAELPPETQRQLRLRLHNACLLGLSFVEAGFHAVVDDIVIGDRLDHLLDELAGHPFVFVMLTPRREVIRARERERGTHLWPEWEWLNDVVERQTRRLGLWLDSSDQTPEQTVDEILTRAWCEGLVEAPLPRHPEGARATEGSACRRD
jgi:predicted kinase